MLEKEACTLRMSLASKISCVVCPARNVGAEKTGALQQNSSRISLFAVKESLATPVILIFILLYHNFPSHSLA